MMMIFLMMIFKMMMNLKFSGGVAAAVGLTRWGECTFANRGDPNSPGIENTMFCAFLIFLHKCKKQNVFCLSPWSNSPGLVDRVGLDAALLRIQARHLK